MTTRRMPLIRTMIEPQTRLVFSLGLTVATLLTIGCIMSGGSERVVFTSERDGNIEVYSVEASGEDPQRLTNSVASESMPSWSPDRKQTAFLSDDDQLL